MPVQPYRPAALTGRIFRGADVVRRGLLTPSQLRSRAWQRIRHDDYADARLERDQKLACRAVMTRLPAGTVLAGPSAAFLLGAGHAAQFTDDIHVITAPAERIGTQRQLRVHHTNVLPGATVDRSGVLLTTATRTAWDCALWLGTAPAVSIVDVLLARGLTTAQALDAQVRRYAGKPGRRRAEKVFGLADPGCAVTAGVGAAGALRARRSAGTRHPAADRLPSGLIPHPDLRWEQWRVAVEYDGVWHADADQLHRDRRRLNQLAGAGWTVLHVTARRLRADFPAVLREVRAALTANGWRP